MAGIIQFDRVSKSYGPVSALHETSLQIDARRTTVLIGPSGCGKSTILRMIIGLIRPDSGTLRFGENFAGGSDVVIARRRRIGYVIQDGGLFPHLSARRNITLLARHLGWPRPRIEQRLAELCELVQLPADRLDSYPVELSGGQRQRVGLMRALMLDPEVLLLDEPLAALDPMIRFDLQNDLKRIFRTLGKTVVMVTHDIGEAAFFGNDVIMMRQGRVLQQGSFDDLLHRPADPFITRFINAQRTRLEEGGNT